MVSEQFSVKKLAIIQVEILYSLLLSAVHERS